MRYLLTIIMVLLATNLFAYRVSAPLKLAYPLTEEQVNQLNKYLSDIHDLTNGRYEMDIVTTTKSGAAEGEFWVIQTGSNSYVQFKNNGHIFTLRPAGF